MVCRECGHRTLACREQDAVDLHALRDDPRRTSVPQQVITRHQAAAGYLWAMGEGGDLYRLNPFASSGEQLEVHDRFWAEAQTHAFHVGRLRAPFGPAGPPLRHAQEEDCAVVATPDRIQVSGLFSRRRRSFVAIESETFLVNSREAFQFVAGHGGSIFALSRNAGQISFCCIDLESAAADRFALAHGDTALCGPVLWTDGDRTYPVVWSSAGLWVYVQGSLIPVALPEAVELWTAPAEAAMNLSPGASPAIAASGQLFLAARQFGRPCLLRLELGIHGWSTAAIAVIDEGTLGASTTGVPLLSASGKLLACTNSAFRTVVSDGQLATRFPAWAHAGLTLFFCEADYRGLKQWLKAYLEGQEVPVSWDLPSGAEVHACNGFDTTGTALACLCVLGDGSLRTEFISWCV